ncbi:MAG: GNAT family N-acetyltransferase [Candidatus Aenigmarchaeota archaeon]|nr:GNAT family N-acetyltransferase [Candidatus Aenigmarchaeota archaeon]
MRFREGKIIERFSVEKNGTRHNLIIRFPKKSDAQAFQSFINPIVVEHAFIGLQKKVSPKQEKKFLSELLAACKKGGTIALVVETNGTVVTSCQIARDNADATRHVAHIGIAIAKDYRRLGLGTRLLRLLIEFGQSELHAEVITLSVYSGNKPAQRLYKKVGFVKIGVIPKGAKVAGKYYDNIIMVLRNDSP